MKSRILFAAVTAFLLVSVPAVAQKYAVATGNWSDPIWSATSTGTAGTTSVPTSADPVVINDAIVVTVNTADAACDSVMFGGANAKIAFATGSVLNVYGSFRLFSVTHSAFLAWPAGAKIRFTGPKEIQTLGGWSTAGFSTSFNEIVIDKSAGKVMTDGTNMRLGIGVTLDIVNGTFEMASQDDIETRTFAGTASSANFIVRQNGIFNMVGSLSHIRRASNTTIATSKTGKMTVYGKATIRTTSTNRVNFDGIDVEAGGILQAESFSGSSPGIFNPDTIIVKSGGTMEVGSATNFYDTTNTAAVLLQSGGVYNVRVESPTAFPLQFLNNGTVRYSRSVGPQTIKDMDYKRLEVSFASTKTWTLGTNRIVADSLEVNNTANLQLKASSPMYLTVNGTVRLTSGTLNNQADSGVTMILGDGATISRATGSLANAFLRTGLMNVRYTSSVSTVTTGPELPSIGAWNLYIAGSAGVALGSDVAVGGTVELSRGLLYLGSHKLTLDPSATFSGTPNDSTFIVADGSGGVFKKMTGPGLFTAPIGDTTGGPNYSRAALIFSSGTFSNGLVGIRVQNAVHPNNKSAQHFLKRYWVTQGSGITNFACTAQFFYLPGDVQGTETSLTGGLFNGTWAKFVAVDPVTHSFSAALTTFGDLTAGESSGLTAVQNNAVRIPDEYSLDQNYPNPFNPSTTIRYGLPQRSSVRISIYNLIGELVQVAVDGVQEAGFHTFTWKPALASGMYVYRIEAVSSTQPGRSFIQTRKTVLLK